MQLWYCTALEHCFLKKQTVVKSDMFLHTVVDIEMIVHTAVKSSGLLHKGIKLILHTVVKYDVFINAAD